MEDQSRRQFISTVAKSCLGVSAILGAQDLLGIKSTIRYQQPRVLYFYTWPEG